MVVPVLITNCQVSRVMEYRSCQRPDNNDGEAEYERAGRSASLRCPTSEFPKHISAHTVDAGILNCVSWDDMPE